VVVTAGRKDIPRCRRAGETVPRLLVSALRLVSVSGYGQEDAQDLTQGFFARLLEKN
jgi:hypothetical protein